MDESVAPTPQGSLSKVPSWILLGFAFGALTVILLREANPPPRVPSSAADQKSDPGPALTMPRLTTIEAQFEEFGKYAIWDSDNITEVKLFNPERGDFLDSYQVLRSGDKYFFRSIPRLTRRELKRGVPESIPLRFTETEESYQAWQKDFAQETNKRFQDSFRRAAPAPKTEEAPGLEINSATSGTK